MKNIIIGAGAGLSAAGGLDYSSAEFTAQCFPHFAKRGYKNIMQILGSYWRVSDANALEYYAVWARHIHNIRYIPKATDPYLWLKEQVKDKDYFVITTNVDHQFHKAGFDSQRIFAMQGDYGLFQCATPCSDDLYDNKEWIETTLGAMPDPFHIRPEDIPHCPHCGNYLVPNLRMDSSFVERPHLNNAAAYKAFLQKCYSEPVLLLEYGVGFNTPTLIRYPFEQLARQFPDTVTLIRINTHNPEVPNLPNCFSIGSDQLSVVNSQWSKLTANY